MNNFFALLITFALALAWLRINNFAAACGWVSSDLDRKLIHMGTGPVFVLCWLLFRDTPDARWLAALVPLAITLQFALVGTGIIRDPSAVQSMSRSGDRREILRGPLLYGIVFVILTLVYWTDSPIGIIALMLLCGGDGLADILGRRVDSLRIPWNRRKSLAGSLAMFAGGFIFAAVVVWVFVLARKFAGPFSSYLLPIAIISLAGALIESLPLKDVDNVTVTLAAVALGYIFF